MNNLPGLKSKWWLLVFLVVVLVVVALSYIFLLPNLKPKKTNLSLREVARVGEETLYYKDVFAVASSDNFSYFPQDKVQEYQNDEDVLLNLYLNKAIEESVLLQEGQSEGFIELSPKVFNSKDKDYKERSKLALMVSGKAAANLVERFNIQTLIVYSDNRDQVFLTKAVLDDLRREIENGALTLKESGERVKNNQELQNLSKKNQNPYRELFNLDRDHKVFPDTKVNRTIYLSEINELSPVTLLKPSLRNYETGRFEEVEIGYVLYKVTLRAAKDSKSYSDWLQSAKAKYKVEIL